MTLELSVAKTSTELTASGVPGDEPAAKPVWLPIARVATIATKVAADGRRLMGMHGDVALSLPPFGSTYPPFRVWYSDSPEFHCIHAVPSREQAHWWATDAQVKSASIGPPNG